MRLDKEKIKPDGVFRSLVRNSSRGGEVGLLHEARRGEFHFPAGKIFVSGFAERQPPGASLLRRNLPAFGFCNLPLSFASSHLAVIVISGDSPAFRVLKRDAIAHAVDTEVGPEPLVLASRVTSLLTSFAGFS